MRHDDVVSAMVSGGVDNMEKISVYVRTDTNVSIFKIRKYPTLLNKKEQNDNEGTVISIKSKDTPTK